MFFLLLLVVTTAHPFHNIECSRSTDIMPDRIRLTSNRQHNMENKCTWHENIISFPSVFYLKIDRTYATHRSDYSDSILSIYLEDEPNERLSIDIHNDKIVSGDEQCRNVFAYTKSRPFWIRIQLEALVDLKLTFISLSYAHFKTATFIECLHIERKEKWSKGYLSFQANTHSGMDQNIRYFSNKSPFTDNILSNDFLKKIEARFSILETRLNKLEKKIVFNNNQITQKHNIISERHDDITHKIQAQKQHINLKSTNQFMIILAIIAFVVVLLFWYAKVCIHRITIINKDHVI